MTTRPGPQTLLQGGTPPPPPPVFDPEEDRPEESEQPKTAEELQEEFDWRTKMRTDIVSMAEKWAEDFGLPKFSFDAWVRDKIDGAINYVNANVFGRHNAHAASFPDFPIWTPQTPEDWGEIYDAARDYYSIELQFDLSQKPGGSDSGAGRRGPSGPSAEEIRNSFDEDAVTEAVGQQWRAYLVEEAPNARAIAKAYINDIVKTGGQQEIDFDQYVLGHIRKTEQYNTLYKRKLEGQSELQYLQPYIQSAMAVAGGGKNTRELTDLVTQGAALAQTPDEFRSRLARTDAAKNSRGFIGGLEERMRGINQLMRG